ncbi:sodium-coupled monocarboxylate transporter 1-like [Neocloeon triangulifer]|uniref:sodium-coupled monocarboxylate transporter 1-like n=1 Tax=Neocloeon triangulifer TaxID=2078957 RepID=UPI00286EB647|nr:sodium-coupled monocarboxylate transporter 1-like [Neocloeon triangulifer]
MLNQSVLNSGWEPLAEVEQTLGWLDFGVFSAMLGISAIIGCYFGFFSGRENTAKEYLMGGKSMGIGPVSLSLIASHISGITVLGVPAEIYRYGMQYWAVIISGFMVSYTVAAVYVPVFIKLQLTSSYQYLELRFDNNVKRMASVLFVISQMLYIPIVVYVPALAFSQVTGINVHLVTPITCAVCIFYTTLGGLKAVVWTDTLQTILMFASMVAVMVLGADKIGGWGEVWKRNEEGGRLEFFNMDPDPLKRHTFWTVLWGTYFGWLSQCGVGQGMVQRYLSVPNLKSAKWTIFWFSIGLGLSKVLSSATGMLIYASYQSCDPLSSGRVKRPDQLLPMYVLDVAGHIPGFTGLFVAGVFSAALSSMSTGLNALSGVIVDDLLADVLPTKIVSKGVLLRLAAALMGAVCVGLVFVVEHLGGVLQAALSLGGITSGTLLGLFTLGMFVPRASSRGALVGSCVSLLLVSFVVFGAQNHLANGTMKHRTLPFSVHECSANFTVSDPEWPDNDAVWPIFRLSYMYFGLLGSLIVLLVGIPVSYMDTSKRKSLHKDLFCPLVHRWLPDQMDQRHPTEVKLLYELET